MCNCKECKEAKKIIDGNEQYDELKQNLENLVKRLNPILVIPAYTNIKEEDIKTNECKIKIQGVEIDFVPRLSIVPIPTIKIEDIKEENLQKEFVETCHSEKECGLKEEK